VGEIAFSLGVQPDSTTPFGHENKLSDGSHRRGFARNVGARRLCSTVCWGARCGGAGCSSPGRSGPGSAGHGCCDTVFLSGAAIL
jgi:hypothetical protein